MTHHGEGILLLTVVVLASLCVVAAVLYGLLPILELVARELPR